MDMIDPKWIRSGILCIHSYDGKLTLTRGLFVDSMFNQQELQILLGGVNAPVDLQDLRNHTLYGGLYGDGESTIEAFWKVLESFDQEQRRALLRFVTSCSRPPLL